MNTFEGILKRALDRVPNELDKREGSPIYLAIAPVCFELAEAYIQLETVRNITYADTSIGEDLTRRCVERGIVRKKATHAIRKGSFNVEVPIGERFGIEETTYTVVRKIEEFVYELECEQEGRMGNDYIGKLLPIGYIKNLTTAELTDILIPGEEVESDESLRTRYFLTLESEAYGGNVDDYKAKTKAIDGVGGVKVYPVWSGAGTVKLVIIDSSYNAPSTQLVEKVQNLIDPVESKGEGSGIAPIGHVVTVIGIEEELIHIKSNITLQSGYTWEGIEEEVKNVVQGYLDTLKESWEDLDNIVVRTSYIETRILDVPGVLDIQDTLINDKSENLVLKTDSIPKLQEIIKV